MLTLLEASKLTQDPLKRGVIEIFPRTSPVLERLPFFSINGMAYRYAVEKTLPGIQFRGINGSYDESTGVINPATEPLFIMGGISKVDRALVKTQGSVNDLRARYDSLKAKAAALTFTAKFFNGSSADEPNEFDGLKTRLTGDQVIDTIEANDFGLTLDLLDQAIDAVQGSPDVIFVNKTLRRSISQLARNSNQATEPVNDSFGRQLQAYQGIPLALVEEDAESNPILGFTESHLSTGENNTASIYCVRFGVEEWVSGIQAGGMDVIDQGLQGIHYQTLIEWICGIGCFHPKAASRLRGIVKPTNEVVTP